MSPSMPRPKTALSRLLRVLGLVLIRWGLGAALVLLWQFLALHADSIFFPPPTEIARRAIELWLSGPPDHLFLGDGVFQDIVPSLLRLFAGWSLALMCGVTVGTLIGRSRQASELLDPCLQFLRAIPGPALVPAFILLLGTESPMRISLIAFGSVWPVLLNTVDGLRGTDTVKLDLARSMNLSTLQTLRLVVIPSAAPQIFAGLRTALQFGIILMVVSEFAAATQGIGYFILYAQQSFRTMDMWTGIIVLGVVGSILNFLFLRLERRVLQWHYRARQALSLV